MFSSATKYATLTLHMHMHLRMCVLPFHVCVCVCPINYVKMLRIAFSSRMELFGFELNNARISHLPSSSVIRSGEAIWWKCGRLNQKHLPWGLAKRVYPY